MADDNKTNELFAQKIKEQPKEVGAILALIRDHGPVKADEIIQTAIKSTGQAQERAGQPKEHARIAEIINAQGLDKFREHLKQAEACHEEINRYVPIQPAQCCTSCLGLA